MYILPLFKENIFIYRYGGNYFHHTWNSIFVFYQDHLVLSHIDPTFYDHGGKLEAEYAYHIPAQTTPLFLANFYFGTDEYSIDLDLYKQANLTAQTIQGGESWKIYQKNVNELVLRQTMYLNCQMLRKNDFEYLFQELSRMGIDFSKSNLKDNCENLFDSYNEYSKTNELTIMDATIKAEKQKAMSLFKDAIKTWRRAIRSAQQNDLADRFNDFRF